MENKFSMPTETVPLPSKGLVYPESSPLSLGSIEMKYMSALEEDILTNQNYIKDGTVIDRLLQSLIMTKGVNYDDLIVGDRNAIMVAARVLGYGKDYNFTYNGEEITVDLSKIEPRVLDESLITKGSNLFEFTLPSTGDKIKYKLLTGHDEKKIKQEIKGLQKINKNVSPELSTRLKYMIVSVNGESDNKNIRNFVDNYLLARDSRAFREHIKKTQPDIDLTFNYEGPNGVEEGISIPITANFFWPDI